MSHIKQQQALNSWCAIKTKKSVANPRETVYGWKYEGTSRFVFVAAHAAGDDQYTGVLARKLAERTNGSYVLNKKFVRPSNSQVDYVPYRVDDFNRNHWSHKYQRYVWKKGESAKRRFYKDIGAICDAALFKTGEKPVVVHLHGMQDEHMAIDLGVGLRANIETGELETNTAGHRYSGKITMPEKIVRRLGASLEKNLTTKKDSMFTSVGIGNIYPAYSKRMGVQFHKHGDRDDYAVQMEINKELKKTRKDRKVLTDIISSTLMLNFK